MTRFECLITELASVKDQGELYEVLDNADIGNGNITKTRYGCPRCGLGVTVEYPDVAGEVEETGIHLGPGALSGCLSVTAREDIKTLKERFESTEPL